MDVKCWGQCSGMERALPRAQLVEQGQASLISQPASIHCAATVAVCIQTTFQEPFDRDLRLAGGGVQIDVINLNLDTFSYTVEPQPWDQPCRNHPNVSSHKPIIPERLAKLSFNSYA